MPQDSSEPDFGALLKDAPSAPEAPKEAKKAPAKAPPDFSALLASAPVDPATARHRADPRFPQTETGEGAAAVAMGAGKGILGLLGFAADATGSKELGQKVARATKQLEQEAPKGGMNTLFGMGGEVLPAALGGEGLAALKFGSKLPAAVRVLGSGAAYGATAPESGETEGERNLNRGVSAVGGALTGGAIRAGVGAATSTALKAMASKRLTETLKGVQDTFENFVPTGEATANAVKPQVEHLTRKYTASVKELRREVERSGGVDTGPIRDVAKPGGPEVGDPKSPSGKMLKYVRDQLRPYEPNAAGIDEKLAAQYSALPEGAKRQIERQAGVKLLPSPGAPGDLLHLKELSKKIETHIDQLDSSGLKSPDVERLRQIQKSIDTQVSAFTRSNKKAGTLAKQVASGYEPLVKLSEKPEIRGILDTDPAVRKQTIIGALKQDDPRAMRNLAKFAGSPGSQAHADIFHVVLHDAVVSSMDKDSGEIDAGKFANYFRQENVKRNLTAIQTPHQAEMIKGMENLINFSKTGKAAEGSHGLFDFGRHFFPAYMIARGVEHGAHALLSGHGMGATAIPIASSVAGAGLLVGGSRMIDNLLTQKLGKNFLIAASKVKPDSPEMFKIVDSFSRRLAQAGAGVAAQHTGLPAN